MATFSEELEISESDLLEWSRHNAAANNRKRGKGQRSSYSGMISLIIPGVYLGNKAAASDSTLLKKLSIIAILNIGGGKCYFPDEFEYFRIAVSDSEQVSLLPHFEDACHFAQTWKKHGAIMFHCRGGMHRSPCILAAYLIRNEGLAVTQALEVISNGRPIAKPSPHMVLDLVEFEHKTHSSSKPAKQ